MPEELAEGWWCEVCEFFEPEEDRDGDRCLSCGCSSADHHRVKVVTIGD